MSWFCLFGLGSLARLKTLVVGAVDKGAASTRCNHSEFDTVIGLLFEFFGKCEVAV